VYLHQILAFNGDNISSNDKQTKELAKKKNSFDVCNHARCFNHTMQLAAQTLVKPFRVCLTSSALEDNNMPELEAIEPEVPDEFEDGMSDVDNDEDAEQLAADVEDDCIDELMELSVADRAQLLEETAAVRQTITKVSRTSIVPLHQLTVFKIRQLSFAIINSTTIALPAWRDVCKAHNMRANLIPRDVTTRWNSTYDMIRFAVKYRSPIDTITADKALKLRKFELDDEDWKIAGDLVAVLEVSKCHSGVLLPDNSYH
jgi:hypothetical protein